MIMNIMGMLGEELLLFDLKPTVRETGMLLMNTIPKVALK